MTDPMAHRSGDDPSNQEWKQRHIAIAADGTPLVNGYLAKIRIASMIIKDMGVTTVLLTFIFGWLTGWIPFPMLAMAQRVLERCIVLMGTPPGPH